MRKKVDGPFVRGSSGSSMLLLSHLDRVDLAGIAKVFIWRNVCLARKVNIPLQKIDWTGRVTFLAEPTFCLSHRDGSPRFVKKCMKISSPKIARVGG